MPLPLSKSKALALSERLRTADIPDSADIALLGTLLIEFNGALEEVATRLQGIGLAPTTRLKTSGTIIEKLKRQPHLNLWNIRDLAGARVVQRMSLDDQDRTAERIEELWPDAHVVDRRSLPSHGYRAVHIVPRIDKCSVEIQLRTLYQDTWAQVMEMLGDVWGRAIRYGGEPIEPDAPSSKSASSVTRSEFVRSWIDAGSELQALAELENERDGLQAKSKPSGTDLSRIREIETSIEQDFRELRTMIHNLAPTFSQAAQS